ncbi:hypothetical protein D3C85_1551010 [compost metagenome]
MVMLIGHYDEALGLRQPQARNLAQQLAAEPAIAPILPGAHKLKTPHIAGEEQPAAGDQLALLPDPPPLPQSIGDHGLIQAAP